MMSTQQLKEQVERHFSDFIIGFHISTINLLIFLPEEIKITIYNDYYSMGNNRYRNPDQLISYLGRTIRSVYENRNYIEKNRSWLELLGAKVSLKIYDDKIEIQFPRYLIRYTPLISFGTYIKGKKRNPHDPLSPISFEGFCIDRDKNIFHIASPVKIRGSPLKEKIIELIEKDKKWKKSYFDQEYCYPMGGDLLSLVCSIINQQTQLYNI